MEIDIKITGTSDELAEILRASQIETILRRVIHVSHPIDYDKQQPIKDQPVPFTADPEVPVGNASKKKDLGPAKAWPQVHCHNCGKLFDPPRKTTIHCSKQCYMRDWHDAHKPKTEPIKKTETDEGIGNYPSEAAPHYVVIPADAELFKPVKKVAKYKKLPGSPKGSNFRMFMVHGKETMVSGSEEQLNAFEDRIKQQDESMSRKHKPAAK